jgi:hypothetical protein
VLAASQLPAPVNEPPQTQVKALHSTIWSNRSGLETNEVMKEDVRTDFLRRKVNQTFGKDVD